MPTVVELAAAVSGTTTVVAAVIPRQLQSERNIGAGTRVNGISDRGGQSERAAARGTTTET
jgi:hypothetical protein